jgi:hypothetical protein
MLGATEGALAGWKRTIVGQSLVLTIQLAHSAHDLKNRNLKTVSVTMNKRQLRSLARDLTRAAEQQGLELFAERPWWVFWHRDRAKR